MSVGHSIVIVLSLWVEIFFVTVTGCIIQNHCRHFEGQQLKLFWTQWNMTGVKFMMKKQVMKYKGSEKEWREREREKKQRDKERGREKENAREIADSVTIRSLQW